jgi:uncharacterized protein DUF2806
MSDLAELIKSLPGAAKAFAHLVTEVGDAGAATLSIATQKAKQKAQRIADQTDASTKISRAVTKAAEKYMAANALDIGRRSLDFEIRRMMKQQASREAVFLQAAENLSLDPPQSPPDDVPTDDWLNLFASYAERASSETMRQHWAQILSGEIRKPGAFSLVTLQVASVLDKKLASIIENVCSFLVDRKYIPTFGRLNEGEFYSQLLALDSIGFLRVAAGSQFYVGGPQGHISLQLTGKTLWANVTPNRKIVISCAFLTLAGLELLNIISCQENAELEKILVECLHSQGATHIVARPNT